ncbi:MAG: c-type cytochrome [Anaerolineae bacterium]
MRQELFALGVMVLVVVILPAGIFGYQAWRVRPADGVRVIEVVARAPEWGGFSPDRLTLRAGETVRLRISSPDVVHGLVIPGLGIEVDEIYPGKVVEVDVTPARPGRYAFACTRWCGADHWRMRGVIEVINLTPQPPSRQGNLTPQPPSLVGKGEIDSPPLSGEGPGERLPLYQQLGLDLDAMRHAAHVTPTGRPSAAAGAKLGDRLPADLADVHSRRAIAPGDAFQRLRADPANADLSDDDVWNLIAWAWFKDVDEAALARAAALYARDCAACHGERGAGDGPAGANLPGMAAMDPAMPRGPAAFTAAGALLAASDALLQGKLLRGGMGTGMPEFGSLYTDEELWAMVTYLRSFVLGK